MPQSRRESWRIEITRLLNSIRAYGYVYVLYGVHSRRNYHDSTRSTVLEITDSNWLSEYRKLNRGPHETALAGVNYSGSPVFSVSQHQH